MSSQTTSSFGYFPQYSGLQLNGLDGVKIDTPANNQVLSYNSTAGEWQNELPVDHVNPVSRLTLGDDTYPASEIVDGFILRDCNGADRTDTTATAVQIIAALTGASNGSSFRFNLRNTSDAAETITVAGGTGVTISGTATVAQNNTKEFLVRIDNINSGSEAVTFYSLGTSVF